MSCKMESSPGWPHRPHETGVCPLPLPASFSSSSGLSWPLPFCVQDRQTGGDGRAELWAPGCMKEELGGQLGRVGAQPRGTAGQPGPWAIGWGGNYLKLGTTSNFSVGPAGLSSLLTSVPFQEDGALSGWVVCEDTGRGRSWRGQGRAFASLLLPPSDLLGAFCVSLRSFCPPAVGIRADLLASRLCIKALCV